MIPLPSRRAVHRAQPALTTDGPELVVRLQPVWRPVKCAQLDLDLVAAVAEKPQAIGWFVGQVMKATGGKANPAAVNDILKAKLGL